MKTKLKLTNLSSNELRRDEMKNTLAAGGGPKAEICHRACTCACKCKDADAINVIGNANRAVNVNHATSIAVDISLAMVAAVLLA